MRRFVSASEDYILQAQEQLYPSPTLSGQRVRRFLVDNVSIFLLLLGAALLSVQMRLQLPLGTLLGADYNAQPAPLFVILLLASAVSALAARFIRRQLNLPRSRRAHFVNYIIAMALAFFGVALLLPDVSLLQMLYFILCAVVLGLLTIWWTPTLPDAGEETTLFLHLQRLWERRSLLRLWTVSNIQARYSQAILGILWIGLLPLSQSLILALVFSRILRAVDIGPVPFIAYFMTSLTFYNYFQQGVQTSTASVKSHMGVIGRVYFPREILVLVKLAEATIDVGFMFLIMIAINALVGVYPVSLMFMILPVFLVQVVLMTGIMLFISYLSVIIRDIPQLVAIVLRFLFYLTPILYPATLIPPDLRILFVLNPLAGLVESYRAVILYNTLPNIVDLYFPAVMGGVLLYTGYLFFKSNELILADYV